MGTIVDQRFPLMKASTPFRPGMPTAWNEWLLSSWNNVPVGLDAYLYAHGETVRHAKAADVLFLGNSRALYGFRPEAFQPHLDRFGLRGYMLAFPSSTVGFAAELINRHDLRPKLLIINSDVFFDPSLARFAMTAIQRGRWGSWKNYFENVMSWEVARRLHAIVPAWRRYAFERELQVLYRSARTGGLRIVYGLPDAKPVVTKQPGDLSAADRATSDRLFPGELATLQAFVRDMSHRGVTIILTVVPYYDGPTSVDMTKRLSQATGVPYVEAWPMPLRSNNGSHMDGESAVQLADVLFEALRNNPAFMKIADGSR